MNLTGPLPDMSDKLLETIQGPSRFLGSEVNASLKDPARVQGQALLLFPDHYDLGMSHLGFKIIYHALNEQPDLLCERAFSPEPELERQLRQEGEALKSLESGRDFSAFDLVGISLPHELAGTNLLTLLDLGGLPILSAERSDRDPVILAGGPAVFNPEPVADFVDAFFLGDGEEGAAEILRAVARARRKGRSRAEILEEIAAIQGVYIPSLSEPRYTGDRFAGLVDGRGEPVKPLAKRTIPDLDQTFTPTGPIIPYGKPVHDRLSVELARGCGRGCRFCQAGMIYRPSRERSPEKLLEQIATALKKTGYDELSLLSLSAGDYTCLIPFLSALMERLEKARVSVSLPSLRADTLTRETARLIRKVRMTGFTLAPEAGSQRLREVINKNLTEEQIVEAAEKAASSGWRLIKLYFMVGLPTETEEDLEELVALVKKISGRCRGVKLNVSLGGFVPKSQTPFQWEPQVPAEEMKRRMLFIRDGLKKMKAVRIKWNSPWVAVLDGLLSRGDRRLAGVVRRAWSKGSRFEAWTEHFNLEPWLEALEEEGLSLEEYLGPRELDQPLPWDHLAVVSRKFLLEERRKAYAGIQTPDCREEGCQGCGICDLETVAPRRAGLPDQGLPAAPVSAPAKGEPKRFLFSYHKLGPARFLGHLELVLIIQRALRRAGMEVAYSLGFHPQPKTAFFGALPVGTESLEEWFEAEAVEGRPLNKVAEALNRELPEGLQVTSVLLPETKHKLESMHYRISPEPGEGREAPAFKPELLEQFLAAEEVLFRRERPGKVQEFDLRGPVREMSLVFGTEVELVLTPSAQGATPKPEEIVRHVFGLEDHEGLRILKMKTVLERK